MSTRLKRKHRMGWFDKVDLDVLEATSESFRIEVDKAFQKFLTDDSIKEYSFPSDLNNFERKHIHQKAATYNLVSRSHGKDPNRILTIYKKGNKSNFESFFIDITPESSQILENLVKTYSPDNSFKNCHPLNYTDKVFGKLNLGPAHGVSEPKVSPHIKKFQTELPVYKEKKKIMGAILQNQVVIISSETGSGKTTQIPQYIMDDCREKGEKCRILCTQPRRISAVSVAERVAFERGSTLGEAVGYHIRLESKLGVGSNLIYCTNGVLIRSLMSGDVLSTLTHIIIDEVHERDKLSDFLLICLREGIKKGAHIKLILMSATMNVEKFRAYFDHSYVLNVPGRLFEIKEFFLDDILQMTGYDSVVKENKLIFNENSVFLTQEQIALFDGIIMQCTTRGDEEAFAQLLQYMLSDFMPVNYQHSATGATGLMAASYHGNADVVEKLVGLGADAQLPARGGVTASYLAEERGHEEIILIFNMANCAILPSEDLLSHYYKTTADDEINYDLLTRLVCKIHKHNSIDSGAILVFLPGYDDIMICHDRLVETDMDRGTYRIFFLHGAMNIGEQHEVFKHLNNVRKIILSTNIAETSLTIDDVVYVVDSGKAKVQTYDSVSGLSSLQTTWISKACVKQRAGRAGRTAGGACFHLFSKSRFSALLDERVPEILRVPLEELCLNAKTLGGNLTSIYNFLVMAPDPPSSNTVKVAIENLECLGALDSQERLTPLGEYLSQLTIEPHLGKMLIYSVVFKCLDPVLTIVASLAQKDPFQLPPQANLRTCAAEKRKALMSGTYSDHIVYLKAFIKWQEAMRTRKERVFCREFFISPSTMETILKTRSQLLGQLRAAKFVPPNGSSIGNLNVNSENWPLIKAVISSGLYPKFAFKKNGVFCTRTEKKVLINNSSPLNKETPLWLVYDEMVKVRNGHQVRGVSPVTPLTVSLMCGVKVTYPMQNYLEIDDWLEFEFSTSNVCALRKYIERIIEKKLLAPTNVYNSSDEAALNALAQILLFEDQNVNLVIPQGINQKPRFFEINRAMEMNNYGDWRGHPPSGDRFPHHQQRANHSNRPRMLPVEAGPSTSRMPALPVATVNFNNEEKTAFVLIRVKQENSMMIAHNSRKWVYSPQTEKTLFSLDNDGNTIFLVFTVPKMNAFYGIAKHVSFDRARQKVSGAIEWIYKTVLPYKFVSHIRNDLNDCRIIYDGMDGQRIEYKSALILWDIYSRCGIPLHSDNY